MTKKELTEKLGEIAKRQADNGVFDQDDHLDADGLLLDFINDKDITDAFEDIEKWYS
jgi:hypothetical protein